MFTDSKILVTLFHDTYLAVRRRRCMSHDWIHSVLEDIYQYARLNNLHELHQSLEAAIKASQFVDRTAILTCDRSVLTKPVSSGNVVLLDNWHNRKQ